MSTTATRPHRLPGENIDYQFRLPVEDMEAMKAIAVQRGWSPAEAMRRAVRLFLSYDMDNGPLSRDIHTGNGRPNE